MGLGCLLAVLALQRPEVSVVIRAGSIGAFMMLTTAVAAHVIARAAASKTGAPARGKARCIRRTASGGYAIDRLQHRSRADRDASDPSGSIVMDGFGEQSTGAVGWLSDELVDAGHLNRLKCGWAVEAPGESTHGFTRLWPTGWYELLRWLPA